MNRFYLSMVHRSESGRFKNKTKQNSVIEKNKQMIRNGKNRRVEKAEK